MTDLERANQHANKRRAELAAREWRKQKREREERRLIELLQAGVSGGWVQRW